MDFLLSDVSESKARVIDDICDARPLLSRTQSVEN